MWPLAGRDVVAARGGIGMEATGAASTNDNAVICGTRNGGYTKSGPLARLGNADICDSVTVATQSQATAAPPAWRL